jgi:hypothetical protein
MSVNLTRPLLRLVTVIVPIVAFFVGCVGSVRPVWHVLEQRWIRDINPERDSGNGYFQVLVRDSWNGHRYGIACLEYLPLNILSSPQYAAGITPSTEDWGSSMTALTQFGPQDTEDAINRDLRSYIDDHQDLSRPPYPYFKILKRENGAIDVTLIGPTRKDHKNQSWYRIQNGKITPQRWLSYGPGFAFEVMPYTLLAGLVSAVAANLVWRKLRRAIERRLAQGQARPGDANE